MSEKSVVARDWELYRLTRAKMAIERYLKSEEFVELVRQKQERIIKDVLFKKYLKSYPPEYFGRK